MNSESKDINDSKQPLLQHLIELRKRLVKSLILISVLFYIYVINYYFSDKLINTVKKNRNSTAQLNLDVIENLPVLKNDTNNVIEFNSGFENIKNNEYKRNFWDLFK